MLLFCFLRVDSPRKKQKWSISLKPTPDTRASGLVSLTITLTNRRVMSRRLVCVSLRLAYSPSVVCLCWPVSSLALPASSPATLLGFGSGWVFKCFSIEHLTKLLPSRLKYFHAVDVFFLWAPVSFSDILACFVSGFKQVFQVLTHACTISIANSPIHPPEGSDD